MRECYGEIVLFCFILICKRRTSSVRQRCFACAVRSKHKAAYNGSGSPSKPVWCACCTFVRCDRPQDLRQAESWRQCSKCWPFVLRVVGKIMLLVILINENMTGVVALATTQDYIGTDWWLDSVGPPDYGAWWRCWLGIVGLMVTVLRPTAMRR